MKVEFSKFAFSTLSVAVELSVANVGNEELGFKTLIVFQKSFGCRGFISDRNLFMLALSLVNFRGS